MEEVRELVVDACKKVLTHFAEEKQIEKERLIVRIDLKHIKKKPVFALFYQSDLIERCSMKDIINAGGGKGLNMMLGAYIRKIIKDIFRQTMKELESKNAKELFLLLYLKNSEPMLAVYYKRKFIWSMQIGEAIAAAPQPGL